MFSNYIIDTLKDKRILFVDDEKQVTDMFCKLFNKGMNIKSDCAYDGVEGLEKFKKYHQDLIVSDIKMPNLDGHQMVKKIFALDKNIKVIFISAYNEEFYHDIVEDHIDNVVYVNKPISTQKFQNALERLYR